MRQTGWRTRRRVVRFDGAVCCNEPCAGCANGCAPHPLPAPGTSEGSGRRSPGAKTEVRPTIHVGMWHVPLHSVRPCFKPFRLPQPRYVPQCHSHLPLVRCPSESRSLTSDIALWNHIALAGLWRSSVGCEARFRITFLKAAHSLAQIQNRRGGFQFPPLQRARTRMHPLHAR